MEYLTVIPIISGGNVEKRKNMSAFILIAFLEQDIDFRVINKIFHAGRKEPILLSAMEKSAASRTPARSVISICCHPHPRRYPPGSSCIPGTAEATIRSSTFRSRTCRTFGRGPRRLSIRRLRPRSSSTDSDPPATTSGSMK